MNAAPPPAGTLLPSPGGQYLALLSAPQEVWGNYLAGFALWAVASPPRLLYHRAGHSAHALAVPLAGPPTFLYWSPAGNWLIICEFKQQQTCQVVFIRAATGQVYRVPATGGLLAQLPMLSQSGPQIERFLQQAKPSIGPLVLDEVPAELRPRQGNKLGAG